MEPTVTEHANRVAMVKTALRSVTVKTTLNVIPCQEGAAAPRGRLDPDVTLTAERIVTGPTAQRPASVRTGRSVTVATAAAAACTAGLDRFVWKVDLRASPMGAAQDTHKMTTHYSSSIYLENSTGTEVLTEVIQVGESL